MPTLDDEWLGGPNEPIEETISKISLADLMQGGMSMQLRDVLVRAAGEIRALRLLNKYQGKRIDDLTKELDAMLGPDDDDR
jgi:hypothetical protein